MVLRICSDVQMENSSQLVGNVMASFSASMEVMKQIAVSSSVTIVDSFNAYCMHVFPLLITKSVAPELWYVYLGQQH